MSPSIPTKDCPRCHAPLMPEATECPCEHPRSADAADISNDLLTQAEELYETHLRARRQRAMRLTRTAKVDLLRDPTNVAKKAQLREAENQVLLLEKQLALQSTRIANSRTPAQQSNDMAIAAMGTFRAAQNVKAEQSVERNRLQTILDDSRIAGATGAFNAAQAGRASEVVQAATGIQTCPNCNAPIKTNVTRCTCGYALSGSQEGKERFSAEELSALRENT